MTKAQIKEKIANMDPVLATATWMQVREVKRLYANKQDHELLYDYARAKEKSYQRNEMRLELLRRMYEGK